MSTRIEHKHTKKKEILKCEFNAIINLISSTSSLSFLQRQRQRIMTKKHRNKNQAEITKLSKINKKYINNNHI